MSTFLLYVHYFLARLNGALTVRHQHARDQGQATTEYALVILGAAMIALLVVAWATAGGGAGKIGQLFDTVLDSIIGKVS